MKTFIAIAFISISSVFTVSIYTHQYTSVRGGEVPLSQYQGKKILLVNIATESPKAATQIPQMEQLYQLYKDSLVVVGFPSNDFGNEPRTDNDIKLLMQNTYHAEFPVAILSSVKDSTGTTHSLYKWLQHKNQNGIMDVKISKDFQKILIDRDGNIIAFFSSTVEPMSSAVQNAITNN
jgi:glutathione peroxidase